MTTNRFAADHLTKAYGGVLALDDVSIEFRPGEVHCIAGENGSGKSTLIKVMSGVVAPDAGLIHLDGHDHPALLPREAVTAGVQVIFQDFALLSNLTIAENIALSTYASERRRFIHPAETRRIAERSVEAIGVDLDLDALVSEVPVSTKQLVAIARALNQDVRLLFMDEPTTTLTRREVARLFTIVERLKDRGVATVFVSHKLDEVTEIAQHLTILRNGRVVTEGPIADYDRTTIAHAMTGTSVVERRDPPPTPSTDVDPVLEVCGLGREGRYADITFDLRPGEVLGLTGLLGSGRSDIAESLFGMLPPDTGEVRLDGAPHDLTSPRKALSAGIGYVPADRLSQGLFLTQSIRRNSIAAAISYLTRHLGWLRHQDTLAAATRSVSELRVKAGDIEDPVSSLSGGNQQRVVLAKWLATKPRVFVLNAPTVGVDIGSKQELLQIIARQARAGIAVLIVSDDIPELVQVAHRVIVVSGGRIAVELRDDDITIDRLYEELAE